MAQFKKVKMNKDKQDALRNSPKARIDEDMAFWLNKTKSGKGVIIVIDDQAFISSLANVQEFVAGDRRGVRFNLLKSVEENEED